MYFPHGSRPAKSKKLVEVFPAQLVRGFPRLRRWRLFTGATRLADSPLSFHRATLVFLYTTLRIQVLEMRDLNFTSNAELGRLLASLPLLQDLRRSNVKSRNTSATGVVSAQCQRYKLLRA